jgi:hypothetical protein
MPMAKPSSDDRDDAEIELGALEPHLEGQTMHPIVLAGLAQRNRLVVGGAAERVDALPKHQSADGPQKHDIQQRDDQIELAQATQHGEDLYADRGAGKTADQQHKSELDIKRAAAEMRKRAGNRRGDNLVCAGGNRHRGRDVVENQKRRDQKAAAHAKHAGQETHCRAHP